MGRLGGHKAVFDLATRIKSHKLILHITSVSINCHWLIPNYIPRLKTDSHPKPKPETETHPGAPKCFSTQANANSDVATDKWLAWHRSNLSAIELHTQAAGGAKINVNGWRLSTARWLPTTPPRTSADGHQSLRRGVASGQRWGLHNTLLSSR